MKNIAELVNTKFEIETKVAELNLWLSQKSTIEYYNYLQNGGNARTAKDKVIDEIKVNDETWMLKEEEYKKLKVYLTYLTDCIKVLEYVEDIDSFLLEIKGIDKN